MLIMDSLNKKFEKIPRTDLLNENLLERYDLQQSIYNTWDIFKNEIGLQNSILVGQEVCPHTSVQDSIDLLAIDLNDYSLVVIELKRDRNKFQLLQALSYAAMVSEWGSEEILDIYKRKNTITSDESIELIRNAELSNHVKIILIAERYDPEVIITSNWLSTKDISIKAYSVRLHQLNNQLLMDVDQKFPLPELSETYIERRTRNKQTSMSSDISWNDIIPKLKYPFASRAIELCRKIKGNDGDPSRRRFVHILTNVNGFETIAIYFREKYMNIGTTCLDKQAQILCVKEVLGENIEVSEWDGGISFQFSAEETFNKFQKWMKI